ncbi:unnamed protein product [Caenorhabditis angaria]|uniref:RAI1-like domain-containing protein n=1 Tax=Caenorhabditis angaria TaxID=860376 RepID=A0A9P1IX87_9PELO|nr:unnamed protein product [Caenorhabditis angaria]
MLKDLVQERAKVGLKINEAKTKTMRNRFALTRPIEIGNKTIEDVDEYVYLGRQLNPQNELLPEIHRRRRAGWAAYESIEKATDAITCQKNKARLFDQTVLPALCYGSEAWTLTKKNSEALRVSHAALERRLVGITLSEQRERNLHREDIRKLSQVKDPLRHIRQQKTRWAGHMARRNDNRWSTATLDWYPRDWKRPVTINVAPKKLNQSIVPTDINSKIIYKPENYIDLSEGIETFQDDGGNEKLETILQFIEQMDSNEKNLRKRIDSDFICNRGLLKVIALSFNEFSSSEAVEFPVIPRNVMKCIEKPYIWQQNSKIR